MGHVVLALEQQLVVVRVRHAVQRHAHVEQRVLGGVQLLVVALVLVPSVLLAIAAALVFAFVIALIAFVMAVLVAIGLWWVALLLLVLLLLLAGLLAWRGIKRVSSTKFTPSSPKPSR